MIEEMTTRRALEICLSRLPMTYQAERELAHHLAKVIREGEPPAPNDADALRAAMLAAEQEIVGVETDWPKAAIVGRLHEARMRLRWARRGKSNFVDDGGRPI